MAFGAREFRSGVETECHALWRSAAGGSSRVLFEKTFHFRIIGLKANDYLPFLVHHDSFCCFT